MDEVGITNGWAMVEVPNRSNRMVMLHSVMEFWRAACFFGVSLVVAVVAMDQHERAAPACLSEEMAGQIDEMPRERAHRRARQALGVGIVGPIDDEGLSDDVLPRDKSPIAAVQGIV